MQGFFLFTSKKWNFMVTVHSYKYIFILYLWVIKVNIVPTNVLYNSSLLKQNLSILNFTYPFLNIQTVGNSVLGKPIYVVKLGNGNNKVFYSAGIHR